MNAGAQPRPALFQILLAAAAIWLALVLPESPGGLNAATLLAFPLELLALLLLAMATGRGPAGRTVRLIATLFMTLLILLKLADLAMHEVLGRPFNPIADLPLIDASVRVVAGSFGVAASTFAVLLAMALILGISFALWWSLGVWSRLAPPGPWPAGCMAPRRSSCSRQASKNSSTPGHSSCCSK